VRQFAWSTDHLREGILDAETATTVQFESSIAVSGPSGPDKQSECPLILAIFFAGKTSTMLFLSFVSLRPPLDKRSLLTFGSFSGSNIHREPCQHINRIDR
jgi:hypothetical protein